MYFPGAASKLNLGPGLKRFCELKLWTTLASRLISQTDRVPVRDLLCLTWGNKCLQQRIPTLQGRISSAMIAVQVGIDQKIERSGFKYGLNKCKRLRCVGTITTVYKQAIRAVIEQNIVR